MAEQAYDTHSAPSHEDAPDADAAHHIVPLSTYLKVFAALMVLLVLTLAVAAVDFAKLGAEWAWVNVTVAVTVAVIKAALVILYFMHVRYSSRLVWFFAGAAFLWLVVMFALTFADYFSRHWIPSPGAWTVPGQ